jgi:hypothetical protein
VYVPFVLGRKESIFVEISFPHRRRDDEDRQFVGLSLGEIPSDREKAQRSDTLETLECFTALSFFQEVYFSVRAKPYKTMVRTPTIVRSLRDVFTCSVLVLLVDFDDVLPHDGSEPSSVRTLSEWDI